MRLNIRILYKFGAVGVVSVSPATRERVFFCMCGVLLCVCVGALVLSLFGTNVLPFYVRNAQAGL